MDALSRVAIDSAVVGGHRDACAGEEVSDLVRGAAAAAVHERASPARLDEVEERIAFVGGSTAAQHRHRQVVADESRDPLDGGMQAEARRDVVANARRGGGGECTDGRPAARRDGVAEAPVVGPEVVPPARDAVRLVDDEAVHRQPAELVEEARRSEALRGEVEEAKLTCCGSPQRLRACCGTHLAVHAGRRHAEVVEAGDLVDHQRDERRHHDGEPAARDPRHPVRDALAGTGRRDEQDVRARF